jgi:hypothetical protein
MKVWVFNWFMWYLAATLSQWGYPAIMDAMKNGDIPTYSCVEITDHGSIPSNGCTDPMPTWRPWQ